MCIRERLKALIRELNASGIEVILDVVFNHTAEGNEKGPILSLIHIYNRKYKDTFHIKAKMIPFEEVETQVGHAPGGVCPFGINENVIVYLDESLRQFENVYPAAGDDHSAVKLTVDELEKIAGATGRVDVCK